MKKVFLAIMLGVMVISCTENSRVKSWGGDGTITLPKGQKLINVTWKETQVWYLTREMGPQDSCQIYKFHEESSWGVIEGTYTIIETK